MKGLEPTNQQTSPEERWVLLGLSLLVAAVYLPTLLAGRVLVDDPALLDVSFNFMPNLHWMAESWRQGEFPLWNPHTHCGMPLLGNSHCGGLYPVTAIIFSLLPYVWAGSVGIIFHSIITAGLFFRLLRDYGVKILPAAAASTVFVFSGSFFGIIYIPWTPASTSGLLLAWLCLRRFLRRPAFSAYLGASLGTAWCGVAGDAELLVYGLLLLYPLLLVEEVRGLRNMLRASLLFSLPILTAFLLLAPLALPLTETLHFSIRGPEMPFQLKIMSVGKGFALMLPTWLFPFQFQYYSQFKTLALNSGLSPLYQGFLTQGFLLWAIFSSRREKKLRPPAVLWLVFFLFITARTAGVAERFFDQVPLLGNAPLIS